MDFKSYSIIIFFMIIIFSQGQEKVTMNIVSINKDTLYFEPYVESKSLEGETFFIKPLVNNIIPFTNNVFIHIKNHTSDSLIIPINFEQLFYSEYSEELSTPLNITEIKGTPIGYLLKNDSLVEVVTAIRNYKFWFYDYESNEWPSLKAFQEKSYDDFNYINSNFIPLYPKEDINISLSLKFPTCNDFNDCYFKMDKDKEYTFRIEYYFSHEMVKDISPKILDYFDKKGYKIWTGILKSNTVKLISFDRLKCCK